MKNLFSDSTVCATRLRIVILYVYIPLCAVAEDLYEDCIYIISSIIILYYLIMLWHYFITLDKSLGHIRPTLADFITLLDEICVYYSFYLISPHPIHSIEFKEKGSVRRKTKIHNYPHYHCIVGSWAKKFTCDLSQFKKYGWSIHIKELKSPRDLIQTAGYIYKEHIPHPRLLCQQYNNYRNNRESVIHAGDRAEGTNNRLET